MNLSIEYFLNNNNQFDNETDYYLYYHGDDIGSRLRDRK